MSCGIYKIENQVNQKVYIGQSTNIATRWRRHRSEANNLNNSYPLYRAMRKYGLENFSFEIIEECSREDLDSRERYWIKKFDSYYNGYNSTLGGHSKRGYSLSESFKEKCRNRRHTQETKQRMSISAKGRKPSTDTLLKMRESAKGNSRRNKAVLLFINGVPMKEFNSVKEAALYNNISTSQMSRLCSGKRNSTTDQIWRYK